MKPGQQLTTLRPDLAGGVRAFDMLANEGGFIAHQVFPVTEVAKQSGVFPKLDLEESLQNPETRRGSRAGYSEIGWKFKSDSFATEDHGLETFIDDRDAEIYNEYYDAEIEGAELVQSNLLLAEEKRAAATLFDPTMFSSYTTNITHEWDDPTNAVPIDNVDTAVNAIYARTGLFPNALIINYQVYRNLCKVDQILDRIKYVEKTLPGDIDVEHLRRAFRLPYIFVAGGTKNTANQNQTAAPGQIWSGEYAMVCRVVTNPRRFKEPGVGRTLHWSADGSRVGGTMESYTLPGQRGSWVRARHEIDHKLMFAEMAQLFTNITT